jgi:hypothetical protein
MFPAFLLPKGGLTMPADSIAKRRAMAIAEHEPEKLYKRNRGMLKMSKGQLHDFASTPEKGLPMHTFSGVKKMRPNRKR